MKLLLDEHFSPEIARGLRARGHDVVSVAERKELVGLSDVELLRRMAAERRAILTNNIRDFLPLANRIVIDGESHAGLLFSSDKSLPRRKATIGRFVRALEGLMKALPSDRALRNRIRWLL